MLGTLLKKRLSDNQLANVFLNGIFEIVDNGFVEVVDLINEDLAFVSSPSIPVERNGQFTMVVVVANISSLETTFETVQATRIEKIIFEQISFENILSLPPVDFFYSFHSLPFCQKESFAALVQKTIDSVRPDGIYAATFFGEADLWSLDQQVSAVNMFDLQKYFVLLHHCSINNYYLHLHLTEHYLPGKKD